MKRIKKILIGRSDEVDFPDLRLVGIAAKVDTGADTSSIHVQKIKFEKSGDKEILSCTFEGRKNFIFPDFRQKMVKSSNGDKQLRYVVVLRLRVFDEDFETEFTLTDRQGMNYPVLLGKKFLKGRFIVDVSTKNLSVKKLKIVL